MDIDWSQKWKHFTLNTATDTPRPSQPPTLRRTRNEYQAETGDALWLGSKGRLAHSCATLSTTLSIMNYTYIMFTLLHFLCLQCFDAVGWVAGRASGLKKTKWWGAGMVVCLERGADLHTSQLMPLPLTASCFSKIQIGFTFLVPAHRGSVVLDL